MYLLMMMDRSDLPMFEKMLRKAKKGQGVVEYAGALVIAVAVVAAVIGIGPDAIEGAFNTVIQSAVASLNPSA